MGITHDSKPSQGSGSSDYAPDIPPYLWSKEQLEEYELRQQEWNEYQSGDSFFDQSLDPQVWSPAPNTTDIFSQSRYAPTATEHTHTACRTAIELHQMLYGIDPTKILISTITYFRLLADVLEIYHASFQGLFPFISVTGDKRYVGVFVCSDISTDIIICIH